MEKLSTGREMKLFVCCFLTTFLLAFFNTHTHHPHEMITQDHPTGGVDFSSFEQWRSAYFCLLNTSNSCPDEYQLTLQGRVNVAQVDADRYCKSGCAQHTRDVLMCIHLAHTHFKFIDNTSVDDINSTITLQCDHATFGYSRQSVEQHSKGRRLDQLSLFINHTSFVSDHPLQHARHSPSLLQLPKVGQYYF